MTAPQRPIQGNYTSLVQVKIGNQVYNARHSPMCKVCQHPARMDIELRLVEGWGYARISREFSDVEYQVGGRTETLPFIKWSQIRYHYKNNHMPLAAEVERRIIEKRAEALGEDLEQSVERFVDQYTVAQSIMYKGHQRLVTGELQPSLQDTLAAAKLVQQIEDASGEKFDNEAWAQAMTVYFEIVQELMPPDTWSELGRRMADNPILAALKKQADGDDAIDAEIVEVDA